MYRINKAHSKTSLYSLGRERTVTKLLWCITYGRTCVVRKKKVQYFIAKLRGVSVEIKTLSPSIFCCILTI